MKFIQIKLPEMKEKPCDVVGIDFGTTHSLVAHYDNHLRVFADIDGRTQIRSEVDYRDGKFIVGRGGRGSVKRFFGAGDNKTAIEVGGEALSPVEAGAKIFSYLRDMAEVAIGRQVTKAVVTVPAYYNDAARHMTKQAAELAGLEVLRLISEPTAAAYAYGIDKGYEGVYCVYDFGGGTFDASVVSRKRGHLRVVATKGDLFLGGDDVDGAIAREIFGSTDELREEAREIKELVSQGVGHESLSAEKLDEIAAPYVTRTIDIMDQAIKESGLDIEGIVLVGGATKLPLVKRMLSLKYGDVLLHSNINPDEAVVRGAALRANAIGSSSSGLLLDVTPLSLGLETMNGRVERIIHRNTPIPISISQVFTTYRDGQTAVSFTVCQGESDFIDKNMILAKFILRGIEPAKAGTVKIKVTFFLDADGVLSVSAEDEKTGVKQGVEIVPSYGLTREDMLSLLGNS